MVKSVLVKNRRKKYITEVNEITNLYNIKENGDHSLSINTWPMEINI